MVRLIYEDVDGKEYTQEVNTATNVKELVIATKDPVQEAEEAKKEQSQRIQWWLFVVLGALAIAALALILGLRKRVSSPRHARR